jgi:hypothetical protein
MCERASEREREKGGRKGGREGGGEREKERESERKRERQARETSERGRGRERERKRESERARERTCHECRLARYSVATAASDFGIKTISPPQKKKNTRVQWLGSYGSADSGHEPSRKFN